MTIQEQLYPLARRAFWGYFFILWNFNLNFNGVLALQLLPNSVGWYLLGRVCEQGAPLRPSLKLLVPFSMGLMLWNIQQFFPLLEGHIPAVLSLLAGLVVLYTHFQFLTDLAALAQEALPGGEWASTLRSARTVLVVVSTLLYCYDLLSRLPVLGILLVVVDLFANLYILWQLWALSKALAPPEP